MSHSSAAAIAAASVATSPTSTVTTTSTKPTFPPIVPSRPIRPYCQPDKSDPLKELPYFLDDLRVKVHYSKDKELKVKHQTTALAFATKVKEHSKILFESKNYE